MTHTVLNQPPPLPESNLYLSDRALVDAVGRYDAGWAHERIAALGAILGSAQVRQLGVDANDHDPILHTHDRFGNRRDEVVFHPAWHALMRLSVEHGVHRLPWAEPRQGAHVARAALMFITARNELGHTCPISMTYSGIAALRVNELLAAEWEARFLSTEYDSRFRPAAEKTGALMGMGMTEKQGGSDVRANTTRAERCGAAGQYRITGHKWFCSAPMCDAFLILAQAPRGLSCFFLARWTPEGEKNHLFLQRLKRKMGNRSNASSEVEFEGAWATLIGEEGRGVSTIIEMVQHTRLDCVLGSAAIMRQALWEALHHVRHRSAFGKTLLQHALMGQVLGHLAIESEAAALLAMRLARAFDNRHTDGQERAFARAATAIAKFWICKRACTQAGEALECLGGNGYVEDSGMPRLYREAPLYSIWEGSGNVICLDVLRALAKDPGAREALAAELRSGDALDPGLEALLFRAVQPEDEARILTERLAIALEQSLLNRYASADVAGAFCESARSGLHSYGALAAGAGAKILSALECD